MAYPPGPTTPGWWMLYRWLRTPLALLDELSARYGDTFSMRVAGLPPVVMTADPESIRTLFAAGYDQVSAGEANKVLEPFLGKHSLLLLDGAQHQRDRKLLMPPFHGERMQAYGRTMLDETDDELDRWPLGVPFSVHAPMQRITLRIIVRTVFGVTDAASRERWVQRLTEMLELGSQPALLVPAFQRDLGPLSPWGRFLRGSARAAELLTQEIHKRRDEYARGEAGGHDILSLLVRAKDERGEPMTDDELREELATLLVAGHETTATALAWSFDLLLRTGRARAGARRAAQSDRRAGQAGARARREARAARRGGARGAAPAARGARGGAHSQATDGHRGVPRSRGHHGDREYLSLGSSSRHLRRPG